MSSANTRLSMDASGSLTDYKSPEGAVHTDNDTIKDLPVSEFGTDGSRRVLESFCTPFWKMVLSCLNVGYNGCSEYTTQYSW